MRVLLALVAATASACADRALHITTIDLAAPPENDARDLGVAPATDLSRATDLATQDLGREPTWQWLSPSPSGAALHAVGGTSASDVWLAGGLGGVWHFDGERVTPSLQTGAGDTYFAVAALAPNDVWVAGNSTQGSLWHFDGAVWSSQFALGTHAMRALAGAPGGVAVALTDDDETWIREPGGDWFRTYGVPAGARAAWVDGADDIWIAGDAGLVGHLDAMLNWTRASSGSIDLGSDGFGGDKSYLAVGGSGASDVWAVFSDANSMLGFMHFDGKSWTRTIGDNDSTACGTPTPPLPRAGSLVAVAGSDAVVLRGACEITEVWDGTEWARGQSAVNVTDTNEDLAFMHAVWSDGGSIFAVGDGFAFARYDGTRQHLWLPVASTARRDDITHVAPISGDVAFATAHDIYNGYLSWSAPTWSPQSLDFGLPEPFVGAIAATSANDAWMIGTISTGSPGIVSSGIFARFDGTSWETPTVWPQLQYLFDVWMRSPSEAWAVGQGEPFDYIDGVLWVLRSDGGTWQQVSVPITASGVASGGVFGTSDGHVFVTAYDGLKQLGYVLAWNGKSFDVAFSDGALFKSRGANRPWAASASDVWIPDVQPLHFDGSTWTYIDDGSDLRLNGIAGDKRGNVWAVGEGVHGGAIWRFDGTRFVPVVDTPNALRAISVAPDGSLWAVGNGGDTLVLPAE